MRKSFFDLLESPLLFKRVSNPIPLDFDTGILIVNEIAYPVFLLYFMQKQKEDGCIP